ncbi:hypothetical protein D3C83_133460 [compost metagenome]
MLLNWLLKMLLKLLKLLPFLLKVLLLLLRVLLLLLMLLRPLLRRKKARSNKLRILEFRIWEFENSVDTKNLPE